MAVVTIITASDTSMVRADNYSVINESHDSMNIVQENLNEKAQKQSTSNGYIESDLDNDTPLYVAEESLYTAVPTAYPENGIADIRAEYPVNRNQNPYGTCWAFSSTGLAEFDLINDGLADKDTIDFSEAQLAYFTYNFVTDPLGGTEGDIAKYYNELASTTYQNRGGNFEYSVRRLSQWIGMVNESDVPYSIIKNDASAAIDSKYAYGANQAHLQNAYEINIKQQPQDVKQMIKEHGAVGAMYYDRDAGWAFYGDDSYTYYDSDRAGGGHAIMIVGWDDNFSKDNFRESNRPADNGAWLVRNSWGDYKDYFWMSYDTVSLVDTAWVFDMTGSDNYDNNYQLDGGINTFKVSNYTTMANVFTVNEKAGVTSELLNAVSLSMTREANVGYTIQVYTDLTSLKDPTSGTPQETATTEGKSTYAGFYTVQLSNPVKLKPGSSFSVVVTLDKPALDHESAYKEAKGDTVIWDCEVNRDNSRSFYKYGTKFYNITYPNGDDGNLCIKAFTTNCTDVPDIPDVPDTPDIPDTSNKITPVGNENTGVLKGTDDKWYYFSDGEIDTTCNDVLGNSNGWWVIRNGKVDFDFKGIAGNKNGDWYCEGGRVLFDVNGVLKSDVEGFRGWYYIKGGKVKTGAETVQKNSLGWWYIGIDGKVDFSKNTVAKNDYGWWAIQNGQVNFKYNGIASNQYGSWYCKSGQVDFKASGVLNTLQGWYYIMGGKVQTGAETVQKNSYGWWYIGIDGKVEFNKNTVAKNDKGWWVIQRGQVNFKYNGIASNQYGSWYCKDGKVDFGYTGQYKDSTGKTYNIVKGLCK